jgi:hypothetical protein
MYSYISLGENIYTYILLKYILNVEYDMNLPFDRMLSNISTIKNILDLYKDHTSIDAFCSCYFNNYDKTIFPYDDLNDIKNTIWRYSIKIYQLSSILSNSNTKILLRINKFYDSKNDIIEINNLLNRLNINYIMITINNSTIDIITDNYINLYIPFINNYYTWYNEIIQKLQTLQFFNTTISKNISKDIYFNKMIDNLNRNINNMDFLSDNILNEVKENLPNEVHENIYFYKMINNLSKDNNINNLDFLLKNLITSFSPYFISNHYIGDELEIFKIPVLTESNNILKNNNIETMKNMDILFVQNNYFDIFISNYLPNINIPFILITGQWNLPQLHVNEKTIGLLNNNYIHKWFSQNPIFEHEKYLPFPYGLNYGYNTNNPEIKNYAKELLNIQYNKIYNITNLPMNYETNNCRNIFEKLPYMNIETFYNVMNNSKFILSPIGDRNDTYRHWEAIGFGTIPISNVGELYKKIFKDNMMYVDNTYDMLIMYNSNIDLPYKMPNKNIICLEYWKDYIKNNI